MENPLARDLDGVLSEAREAFEALRGARLFVTGGTGFFGGWLLESLAWADARLDLGVEAVVLTRDPGAFRARRPHLAGARGVSLLRGDVASFAFPEGRFTHVVHAATPASAQLNLEQPLVMLDTILAGTRRVLDFTAASGAGRLLFTSSGAVYGRQPPELERVPEDSRLSPDPNAPASAYGEGKRAAELLCAIYAARHGFTAVDARCWAFAGPYLPLDGTYAIGNFVRDALRGGPIRVGGDGTPWRSYLYGADLAAWLWTLLAKGQGGRAYHVGAEEAITIAGLARLVAEVLGVEAGVELARAPEPGRPAERYVPSTRRTREELGVRATVGLEEAIRRTAAWASRPPR
ncbi:NAD-dependent epimerase/dehydratase family protein [Anaeromyxobacter paludicola]|uniref:dTDP-glucose 4,6-dehydratase n=1 Tax=Anaeromyxobacter paludicola TaxID=2918171 RepID=A0ABN6N1X2_9BACT|nr:NAD(P)-dependent oxidoreductase [Anaeromyxobacter paludicola]BDG07166.1 dTDP-glucose 4,6-dehydratase [Anaeromyxobacter paludicola]